MVAQILNSKNVLILPHKNADGDCLGCAFALKLILDRLGKCAVVKTEEEIPERFANILYTGADVVCNEFDLAIAVDCGDLDRLGDRAQMFLACGAKANIDHHITNENFGDTNFVDAGAAAAGELVYELCLKLGVDIDKEIATNLYIAIASDTGGFLLSNVNPGTFRIAAELLSRGAENEKVNKEIFRSNTFRRLMLTRCALGSLELLMEGRLAIMSVRRQDLVESGTTLDDCEGLVSIPRNIRGVKVAVFIKETDNGCKASLRSDGCVDLAAMCTELGGGGHVRAAGCEFECGVDEAREILVDRIRSLGFGDRNG